MANCTGRCSNCYFKQYAAIPAPQAHKADIAIIGSSPEAAEFVAKQPIAGLGKQMIEKLIEETKLPKWDSIYKSIAFLCRGPKKKEPHEEAMSICRPRLIEELVQVKPKLIIVLGNTALRMVTGNPSLKITQEQGKVTYSNLPELKDIPIMPTFHPGKVIRDPAGFKFMRAAFQYAAELYEHGDVRDPGEPKFALVNNEQMADEAIKFLGGFKQLTMDIETGGFIPYRDPILCLGIRYAKNKTIIFAEDFLHKVPPLLSRIDIAFNWHNGKFDSRFLTEQGYAKRPVRKRLLFGTVEHETTSLVDDDSMMMHYALVEDTGTHDLEQLAGLLIGAPPWESVVKKAAGTDKTIGYSLVPREILYPYLGKDCDYTGQVKDVLWSKLEKDPVLKRLYTDLLIPASSMLQEVESVGVFVDVKHIGKLRQQYLADREEVVHDIMEFALEFWDADQYVNQTGAKKKPEAFKLTSPKQVAWLLYDKMGVKPHKNYGRTTNKDALQALMDSGITNPLIAGMAKMRSIDKMIKTYMDGIEEKIGPDGRVHSSFLIHGTATGRLSSRGPNLQNIPGKAELRSIICAAPGNILIEADYRAAELRMMAHLSGDKFLEMVYAEQRDLHTEVTIAMFGPPDGKDKDEQKQERLKAKTLNFGIPYGREAYSISLLFNISIEEAQKLIDDWFARMPECAVFLQEQADAVKYNRLQQTPLGRRKRLGVVTRQTIGNLENEARNYVMQSTASDMTLLSAIEMQPKLRRMGSHVINLIHDATLSEAKDDPILVYMTAKIQTETMASVPERVLKSKIPFETEFKIGSHWGWTTAVTLDMLEEAAVLGISPWDVIEEAKVLEKEYGEDGIHTHYIRKTDKGFDMTLEEIYEYFNSKYEYTEVMKWYS